ncbi:hypothetical protein U2F26_34395 [Micromonospora sp. 4G57]|uniref:Uncharacterized protein n=1 Tax=Micromonospora sicca TaxID=2202420 RepID=A0ABU5JP67_9ACTN|nr:MULTISPECIES: hypothetical protein [unclassified Micromonospora]MDZ5447740.1 hypothetical protein [Micromonospora sp. 4G57]MDZ5494413.1 hypothetical protein [Micromonospora sp. 4G53]
MRILFWRRNPAPAPLPLPRRVPNECPVWATQPTEVFPTTDPGRAGNLTRAQAFRANGGRW